MQKKAMTLSAVLFFGLAAIGFADETPADKTPTGETPAVAAQSDETLAVEQATNQFYAALNAMLAGDASGLDQIWSHSDDITCMGPAGGILVGWDQVQATWAERAKLKLGGRVDLTDLHVTVGNDLALVEGYELGTAKNAEGESEPFRIRTTNSFRKENGQWKMIGHHTDLFNFLDRDSDEMSDEQPGPSVNEKLDPNSDDDSIDVSEDEVILKLDE